MYVGLGKVLGPAAVALALLEGVADALSGRAEAAAGGGGLLGLIALLLLVAAVAAALPAAARWRRPAGRPLNAADLRARESRRATGDFFWKGWTLSKKKKN